ncbi:MAG: hypothetical protein GY793_10155 [Proteobacteria bacterium]|nr:hypothetical protein [Pseudomonadota bacterium]
MINNKYKHFVDSEITYKTTDKKKCFDVNGDFLGYFTKKRYETKQAIEEIEKTLSLTQINYNFSLLPLGRCITIDEIDNCCTILNNSFDVKFKVSHHLYYGRFKTSGYFVNQYKESEENFTPYEISKTGHSREIINKNYKIALNFNIKKYIKNKENFIKNNPEWKNECESLFYKNIKFMMSFWQMTENQILKGSFNKRINIIKKLNRKITNHETSKQ